MKSVAIPLKGFGEAPQKVGIGVFKTGSNNGMDTNTTGDLSFIGIYCRFCNS